MKTDWPKIIKYLCIGIGSLMILQFILAMIMFYVTMPTN